MATAASGEASDLVTSTDREKSESNKLYCVELNPHTGAN